jgi:hypothetical protein
MNGFERAAALGARAFAAGAGGPALFSFSVANFISLLLKTMKI